MQCNNSSYKYGYANALHAAYKESFKVFVGVNKDHFFYCFDGIWVNGERRARLFLQQDEWSMNKTDEHIARKFHDMMSYFVASYLFRISRLHRSWICCRISVTFQRLNTNQMPEKRTCSIIGSSAMQPCFPTRVTRSIFIGHDSVVVGAPDSQSEGNGFDPQPQWYFR